MTFVALLATGIVATVSTALRVWNRAMRMADLHQEARAVMALLSRDIRNAYLGLPPRDAGYFIGSIAESGLSETAVPPIDTLELTTESSSLTEVALLPDEAREKWDQTVQPPVTDLVGVRWEWRPEENRRLAGLYRVTAVVPAYEPEFDLDTGLEVGQVSDELISTAADELRLRYFDGEQWQDSWDSHLQQGGVPSSVEITLTLVSESASSRQAPQAYTFETVVPIATR